MQEIKSYKFNKGIKDCLMNEDKGENWPVVYLINNDKQMYIGESSNVKQRMSNHLQNPERKHLKEAHIVFDDTYNKSAILDIESLLIQHISADGKYQLQNKNNGQSRNHNYYQREKYINSFECLWDKLLSKELVNNKLIDIENSDLFKFSPYKNLTDEQYFISESIIREIDKCFDDKRTFVINGSAGTGKSVLAVYLIKRFIDITSSKYDELDLEEVDKIQYDNLKKIKDLKIGLVIAMTSLRKTLKNVFKSIPGLKSSLVISPNEVVKQDYDILIVDEAHRLMQRKNITNYKSFDQANKELQLGKEGNQLDWVIKKSRFQILFYDSEQSIKSSDVDSSCFTNILNNKNTSKYYLTSQLRSKGGNDFVKYIDKVFSNNPPKMKLNFNSDDFEVRIFDDVNDMVESIKQKNEDYGLCRNVAGYAWDWKTKGYSLDDIYKNNMYDIKIEEYQYIWNTTNKDWVNSDNALNEIGCVHTVQGYDLNYIGVIIGNDLLYRNNELVINKNNYKDKKGKAGIKDESELKNYIINIYKILISRGINGVYIYATDNKLRNYLKKYF